MNSSRNPSPPRAIEIVNRSLKRRYRLERRFRLYGIAAIAASLLFLALLFLSIIAKGYSAFWQTYIQLDVHFDSQILQRDALVTADYQGLVKQTLRTMFPDVQERREKRQLYRLVSGGAAFQLRRMVLKDPDIIGQTQSVWVPADDDLDMLFKGHFERDAPEDSRRLSDRQLAWIDALSAQGKLEKKFNTILLTRGDSREPELAGVRGAVMGSFYTLVVTLLLSFPIGVAAAVYLEEFAP